MGYRVSGLRKAGELSYKRLTSITRGSHDPLRTSALNLKQYNSKPRKSSQPTMAAFSQGRCYANSTPLPSPSSSPQPSVKSYPLKVRHKSEPTCLLLGGKQMARPEKADGRNRKTSINQPKQLGISKQAASQPGQGSLMAFLAASLIKDELWSSSSTLSSC